MKKMLRLAWTLLVAFCVATVIAEMLILGYASTKVSLGRDDIARMLAAARGTPPAVPAATQAPDTTPPEQPAPALVAEARAAKLRDLELREQTLKNLAELFRAEQARTLADRQALEKARAAFEESVASVEKRAVDSGWEANRQTLLALRPKQAKELIAQMLASDEIEQVVSLLAPMPDAKRARIVAEFKTPDETKKIDEILRRLRQGEPAAAIASGAQQQLGGPRSPTGTR